MVRPQQSERRFASPFPFQEASGTQAPTDGTQREKRENLHHKLEANLVPKTIASLVLDVFFVLSNIQTKVVLVVIQLDKKAYC